jgi:phosphatidylglycerol:prolipoprotein diacylglycerol transferase
MNINLYGVLIAAGMAIGYFLCLKEEKTRKLPKDTAIDIFLYSVPLGLIGARIYYVAFAWDSFKDNPISALYIWQGGMAIYGSIIGGFLGMLILSKKRNIPIALLTDIITPSVLLGQAIGRWGNFFNQEAHGRIVQNAAWQFFPAAVNISGEWYYATFFYESVWNFLGFLFLYFSRKKYYKDHGITTLWYFAIYALGRMVIEMMRTDSLMLGSMRVSQGLSILLFFVAIILLTKKTALHRSIYLLLLAGTAIVTTAAVQEKMSLLFCGASILLLTAIAVYFSMEKKANYDKTVNV